MSEGEKKAREVQQEEELSEEEIKKRQYLVKRSYAIAELLDTERSYIEKLKDAVTNYLRPVLEGKLPGEVWGKDIKEVARIIFVNMEDILKFHEEVFLPALDKSENSVDQIVECFLLHKEEFSLYTTYILGRSKAEQWISRAKEFFEARRKALGDKREFQTYVIAPVQRFTKYKLLLKDIAKYTRYVKEDSAKTEDALHLMTTLPQEANNIVHISMIRGLQHDLLGHGQLRHLGQVLFWDVVNIKRPCDVQVFLFDLRLILTDPQDESGFYQHKADCLLTHSVRVLEDIDNDPLHWTVVYQDKDTEEEKYFHFLSSSIMNKDEWVKHLRDILQSHEELARGLGISRPRPPLSSISNGDCPTIRQLSNLSNSSLEELSSSDLDDDRPQAVEYRPLPEKLRKSTSKQKLPPSIAVAYPRKQLSIFPGTMVDLEEDPSLSTRSPQLFRKALARGESTHSELRKKGSLTPKLLMRSIIRASTKPKKRVRYRSDVKDTEREQSFRYNHRVVKSPSLSASSRSAKSDVTVSSSDEEEDPRQTTPPRHVMVPSSECTTRIFIGRDDISDEVEKTHILMAQPGEVYEVRDRASGSDFWYVKVLNQLNDSGKTEGWIKAKHLTPFQAPFIKCEFQELYQVQKEIGKGRFSTVKICLSRQEPAQLVAKFLPKAETSFMKFAFELNLGLSLKHPNLVRFKEGIEDKNHYIIVMERVPGLPLIPYILRKGDIYESNVAHYVRQLCKGLDFMHKRGLIHLDVRPENILVHSERVKLCDFGATRYHDMEPILESAQTNLEPEQSYNVLYTSPEVYTQEKKTTKTDMWSVGVVTYILLFGVAPFVDKRTVHVIAKIMEAKPSLDGQLISNEGQEFLDRLLTKQQIDRMSATQALSSMWLTTRNGYIMAKLDLSKLNSFIKSVSNMK